jgi:hypothetical protein
LLIIQSNSCRPLKKKPSATTCFYILLVFTHFIHEPDQTSTK